MSKVKHKLGQFYKNYDGKIFLLVKLEKDDFPYCLIDVKTGKPSVNAKDTAAFGIDSMTMIDSPFEPEKVVRKPQVGDFYSWDKYKYILAEIDAGYVLIGLSGGDYWTDPVDNIKDVFDGDNDFVLVTSPFEIVPVIREE